jgi:hypothetical protein
VVNHEATTITVATASAIAAGLVVESLGIYVESYWIDRPRPDRDAMLDTWWKYLSIA